MEKVLNQIQTSKMLGMIKVRFLLKQIKNS